MDNIFAILVGVAALGYFIWLLIPPSSPKQDTGGELIDPSDSPQIGLIIGLAGGGIADGRFAHVNLLETFQRESGHRTAEWYQALPQALDRLRKEYVERGQEELYELLKGFPSAEQASCAQIAAQLGMSEGALRFAIYRFRQRFKQLIQEEAGKNPGDEGDAGSASLPVPKHPLTPHDSAGAAKIPE